MLRESHRTIKVKVTIKVVWLYYGFEVVVIVAYYQSRFTWQARGVGAEVFGDRVETIVVGVHDGEDGAGGDGKFPRQGAVAGEEDLQLVKLRDDLLLI